MGKHSGNRLVTLREEYSSLVRRECNEIFHTGCIIHFDSFHMTLMALLHGKVKMS
jgi:hypothetical protein